MKIDEEAGSKPGQPQIGKNPGLMYQRKGCNGFQLDYHLLVDDQIGPIGEIHSMAVVDNRERNLALKQQITFLKLNAKESMVSTLE